VDVFIWAVGPLCSVNPRLTVLWKYLSSNGSVAQWPGRRSLAGGLSLPCARAMVDM